ncbi:MAG: hypothetical protein JO175_10765, partial [Candidatus Eremiobacteraeota bacterium]|nr:hypothetical protein [Candidatus Eremiobacteraeota bacterium]
MRLRTTRRIFAFAALLCASLVAACNNSVTNPTPSTAFTCTAPACVKLTPQLQSVAMPAKAGVTRITLQLAGSGYVSLHTAHAPYAPSLAALLRTRGVPGLQLYFNVT